MASKAIDRKFLEGLVFKGATVETVTDEDSGREVARSKPFSRPLEQNDVLDWVDNGDTVTLVTADGKKYTVAKKAEKAKE
ncbi:MAG TPA: hypothetical protein HPP94_08665 [Desulfuromonadales bacterium]|nr:hypothetical protein [Desulfuromonadales bacterium]